MSLLSICQNVALDLGVNQPVAPIFGSKVPVAQRLFAQARRAAQSLYRRAPWVELIVEYEFTASGISDYPLPPDFGWMVDNTLWERSRYWMLRGSMSPQKWQLYKSSIYGRATIWRRWRIRVPTGSGAGVAPTFSIDPPISVNDTTSKFVFEYVSRNWCVSNIAGMPQTFTNDWTSDNDESLLDEWLIELETRWRALHRLGLDYSEDQDEAEREIDKAIARNGGGATLDLVPTSRRDDFIGQYSLGAFPPTPPAGGSSFDRIGPPPGRLGPAPPAQPLLPPPPLPVAAPSQNPAPAGFFNAAERGPPGVRPQVAARFVTPPPPAPLAVPPPDAALLPVRRAPRETPAPIVAADNGSKLWIPSGPLMLQHALDRGLVVPPPTEPPAPELAAEEGPLPEPRVIPQGEPEPPARRAEPLPPSLPAPATPPPRRGRPTDAATLLMEPADPEDMPDMPLIPVPQRRRRPRPLLDE